MARLDANVFDFDRHREGLKRLGQHAQKGILLYGPPGTGKTHVIRYVSANLPGRTTVLVTAEQTAAIGFYIALARTLQPSIVVLGTSTWWVGREKTYIARKPNVCSTVC